MNRGSHAFRGFTLVELLVVIAIIGTLVALLLPAVQSARESGRRTSCLNALKQLSLAAIEYEERNRRWVGLFDVLPVQGLASQSGEEFQTWAVELLPDLERQQLHDGYMTGGRPNAYVELFACPSDDTTTRSGPSMSYVANAGSVGGVVHQTPFNGPFLNRVYDRRAAMLEGHWRDGREYTLSLSESLDAEEYDVLGWSGFIKTKGACGDQLDNANPGCYIPSLKDRQWSPLFLWHSTPAAGSYINGAAAYCTSNCQCERRSELAYSSSCDQDFEDAAVARARPSSNHPGGVNAAFAGGRALFLKDAMDYAVFRALMTPNDKRSDSPRPDIIVSDADISL